MCRSILPDCKPKTVRIMNRQEDDKLVLYGGHRLFVMGTYATEIWHMCDGEHTLNDMIDAVVSKYNVPREKAASGITAFLNRLSETKLIQ